MNPPDTAVPDEGPIRDKIRSRYERSFHRITISCRSRPKPGVFGTWTRNAVPPTSRTAPACHHLLSLTCSTWVSYGLMDTLGGHELGSSVGTYPGDHQLLESSRHKAPTTSSRVCLAFYEHRYSHHEVRSDLPRLAHGGVSQHLEGTQLRPFDLTSHSGHRLIGA